MLRLLTIVAVITAAGLRPAAAQLSTETEEPASPFDRGRFSVGVVLGTQNAFGDHYFVVGGGFGYFVVSGLEVSISGSKWIGGGPSVANASPALRYIMTIVPGSIKPFAGGFYNHWFIGDDIADVESIGGTLGIVLIQGHGLVLSLGATVEQIVSECAEDCTSVYPAFSVGFSF